MALFKPLLGKREDLPSDLTSGYAYFCTDDGSFWIDYTDSDGTVKRKQINAQEAEKLVDYDITNTITDDKTTIPTSSAVFSEIEAAKTDISDLSERIDDVENSINTTNETLNGISQEFENYKTNNDDAVSANTSNIDANRTAIAEIAEDYLKLEDKEELEGAILAVSNTTQEALAEKANKEHTHEEFYTKQEITELITTDDIDLICGATIYLVNEVTF